MTEALVKTETSDYALDRPRPRDVIRQATEEANELANVIESRKLYSIISGRKFVRCEGWTTLACLRGCLPREVTVHEMPEGRYVAEVELVRMSDGMVLTRASAECGGEGDNIWKNRPANARRSMAITRATGKAARVAFSWVMALSGYEVTPLEEMDHVERESENPALRPEPVRREWPAQGAPKPSDGAPVWRGKLVNLETKTGTNKSGPWTLYLFHGQDGEKFGTFSDSVASGLTKCDGRFVEIVYEATAKGGKNILEWKDVTLEEVPL